MRKVLVVTYNFPPVGGGRVSRIIKFIKYLREFGWEPVVLTVKRPVVQDYDEELINQLPSDIQVVRTSSLEFPELTNYVKEARKNQGATGFSILSKRWLVKAIEQLRWWILLPDSRVGWIPFATVGGLQIIREEQIDAIFVTGAPFSSFISAALLKFLGRRPLILDFRDEWSEFGRYYFPQKKALIHKINKMLEYIVVRYADIVISVTQIIVDNFRRRYPALEHDKFVCITNGFDPEDFKFLSRDKSDRGFTITYAGSIYPQRTPHYFFEALKELLAEMPEVSSEIKISFLGDIDHRISHLFRQDEISDFVCTTGFLNHRETLSRLINSDLLLFIEDQIAISNRLLPAKLFEYIGAKRPILALVEDGSAKDLLEKIGCGVTVPPKDIKAIAQALKMLYMQRQANRHSFEVDHQKISKFYRRNITEQLAKTLDQVVVSNSLRKVR